MKSNYTLENVLVCMINAIKNSVDFDKKEIDLDKLTARYLCYYSMLIRELIKNDCNNRINLDSQLSNKLGIRIYDAKSIRVYRNTLAHLFDELEIKAPIDFSKFYVEGILTKKATVKALEGALKNVRKQNKI